MNLFSEESRILYGPGLQVPIALSAVRGVDWQAAFPPGVQDGPLSFSCEGLQGIKAADALRLVARMSLTGQALPPLELTDGQRCRPLSFALGAREGLAMALRLSSLGRFPLQEEGLLAAQELLRAAFPQAKIIGVAQNFSLAQERDEDRVESLAYSIGQFQVPIGRAAGLYFEKAKTLLEKARHLLAWTGPAGAFGQGGGGPPLALFFRVALWGGDLILAIRFGDSVRKIFEDRDWERTPVQTSARLPFEDDYWVGFPRCDFLMGSQNEDPAQPNFDPDSFEDERPVHKVSLDEFRIARHPVTVLEFQRFIEAKGYENASFWNAGGFGKFHPAAWDRQSVHLFWPVVHVNWFEASAFARWAGCRLPTEAEWERAARGAQGRLFPWGNDPPRPSLLNFGPSAIGHPTPAGTYPDGKTPEGIYDMLGNVLEWMEDDWHEDYLQAPADGKAWVEQPRSQGRVLRGGCWDFTREHCRAGCRGGGRAEARSDFIGFRLAFTR